MSFTLNKVVPWGRSYEEYVSMFALSENDLSKRILGCSDGPASFNCHLTEKGGHVISMDPLYEFTEMEIRTRIRETFEIVMEQTKNNSDEFTWRHIANIEELGKIRSKAMNEFLSDYAVGLEHKRYIRANLPHIPFEDKEFDIALCSHFLFLYSEQFSLDFHLKSLEELCRTAKETRIFPLLELGSKKSRHLEKSLEHLKALGHSVSIENVTYEFQKKGNEMVKIISA